MPSARPLPARVDRQNGGRRNDAKVGGAATARRSGEGGLRYRITATLFNLIRTPPSAHLLRGETFLSRWRQEHGLEPESIAVERYDPQLAYRCVSEHLTRLDRAERPDLLVCENDALALGAIDAIRYELDLRVPDDIAVTGFDDVPQAASPHYRLTAIRQPLSAMTEGLVRVLKGDVDATGLDRFSGQLVIRDSA